MLRSNPLQCRAFLALVPLFLLGVNGCDDVVGPTDRVLDVRTDRTFYRATAIPSTSNLERFQLEIVVRTRNTGDRTVRLSQCRPTSPTPKYDVELLAGGNGDGHGSAYDVVWGCPGGSNSPLDPGEVRLDTIRLTGPRSRDHVTRQVHGSLTGIMRLQWYVYACEGMHECPAMAASNAFHVRPCRSS